MSVTTDIDEVLSVRLQRVIDAAPESIFTAFTEPDQIVQWWGPQGITTDRAEINLTPGGAFAYRMVADDGSYEGEMSGRFVEITPPTRLVFEILVHCNGAPHLFDATTIPTTTVTIDLRPLGDGRTELTLTHTGFTDEITAGAHNGGWSSSLEKLTATI